VPTEKKEAAAAYKTSSEIQHKLLFSKSPLYNEVALEFGEGYVAKYVDSADLTLLYRFDGAGASEIHGEYSANAVLNAMYNNESLIWKKEYPFIPNKTFRSGEFSDSISLPLKQYADLVDSIEKDTGVTTSAAITVTFTVNASAKIAGETVTDTSVSTLVFDLTKDVLVLRGEPKKEQPGSVEKTVVLDLLPKKTVRSFAIPLFLLAALTVASLLLFTCSRFDDPVALKLAEIYKKYGSRIVELKPGSQVVKHDSVFVKSFQDLLLVADELKKPIFKNGAENYMELEFYVFEEFKVYIFLARLLEQAPQKSGSNRQYSISGQI
jgi:hypothetical protein